MKRPYLVWFDLALDDFLAIEEAGACEEFLHRLAADGIDLKKIDAGSAKEAIAQVFPPGASERQLVSLARYSRMVN